jgi:hypothetical protein
MDHPKVNQIHLESVANIRSSPMEYMGRKKAARELRTAAVKMYKV